MRSEGKKRVLVADSEAWSIQLFVEAGRKAGIDVDSAQNGIEAIEKFMSLTPDLVIVDTLLPKLDGLQVAAKIHEMELGRIIPIIVSSAIYQRGPDVERLRKTYGFADFLEKPFQLEDVEQIFAEYLRDEVDSATAAMDEDGEPIPVPELTEISLSDMGIPGLLQSFAKERKTGILTLRREEITKVLFFKDGQVTHARSNSRRDRLGRILLRNKKITLDEYDRARRLQIESSGRAPLGTALVQLGVLNENDIANSVSIQILSIIFSLFSWNDGSWTFVQTASIAPRYQQFAFDTSNIIFWGLRQLEGRVSFKPYLPSARVILERLADGALAESLHLTYFEDQIYNLVDGKKPLSEIMSIGRLAQIDVERVLYALIVAGAVRTIADGDEKEISSELPAALPDKGDLLSTSTTRLFSRLHLSRISVCVKFENGPNSVSVWFEHGDVVYARSEAEDLRLAQILLDAGKVTPADHERAMKMVSSRSDKRIGAIFLGLRALTLEELDWARRFQVQKIVLDVLSWREGTYSIEPLSPPEDLRITLMATTPDLIMEGVRSAEAPPGMVEYLQAPDMLLVKASSNVARELHLSSAEKRLLSYIEGGRSMQDVRSLGLMSDTELSRTLHGLLALEMVKATRGVAFDSGISSREMSSHSELQPADPDEDEEVSGELDVQRLVSVAQNAAAKAMSEIESAKTPNLEAENQALRDKLKALEEMMKKQQPPADDK